MGTWNEECFAFTCVRSFTHRTVQREQKKLSQDLVPLCNHSNNLFLINGDEGGYTTNPTECPTGVHLVLSTECVYRVPIDYLLTACQVPTLCRHSGGTDWVSTECLPSVCTRQTLRGHLAGTWQGLDRCTQWTTLGEHLPITLWDWWCIGTRKCARILHPFYTWNGPPLNYCTSDNVHLKVRYKYKEVYLKCRGLDQVHTSHQSGGDQPGQISHIWLYTKYLVLDSTFKDWQAGNNIHFLCFCHQNVNKVQVAHIPGGRGLQ